jgi:hypothetical protein
MDSPMTTQPDAESLAQAERLLPCNGYCQSTQVAASHGVACPERYRPAVAAALAELRVNLATAVHEYRVIEAERDSLREAVAPGSNIDAYIMLDGYAFERFIASYNERDCCHEYDGAISNPICGDCAALTHARLVAAALAELRHALAEKIQQWGKVTELFGEKERAYDGELAELRFSLQCARESLAEHEAAVLRLRRKVDAVQAERDSLRAENDALRKAIDNIPPILLKVEAERDELRAAVLKAFGSTRTHSEAWAKLSPLFDAGAQGRHILETARAKGEGK